MKKLIEALAHLEERYRGEQAWNYDTLDCLRAKAQENVCADLRRLLTGEDEIPKPEPEEDEDDGE